MISQTTIRTIQLGARNLVLHKVRSLLTMLGIIFGVASVVAMLAIGEGTSQHQQESIRKLGSTNIIVESVKPETESTSSGQGNGFVLEYGLKYIDATRIYKTVPHIKRIMPVREIRCKAQFQQNQIPIKAIATLPGYQDLKSLKIIRGRFLTDLDNENFDNVCIVTENLAKKLFAYRDPLVQTVKMDRFYYRVVGVVQSNELESKQIKSWDMKLYLPLATSRQRFGDTLMERSSGSRSASKIELHRLIVECENTDYVESSATAIQLILERFHKKEDYEMTIPLQLLRQARETQYIFTIVLACIASISLLVGGIGIMNIMLASITERTREIGVRRALGARKRDIVTQFLVETVILSVTGGLVGLVVGCAIPFAVTYFSDIKTVITPWSLIIAFAVSALTGIIFGIYPANRAANLDPIDALRHE
ncbi:MAG: ABC transporter permease [Lentisphaeria bacterium]|nr:ABC transporter permease [Lentisphaeria bacterium]NQZ66655.1 ABC transporter permease [Lentisphaeria bacterium]